MSAGPRLLADARAFVAALLGNGGRGIWATAGLMLLGGLMEGLGLLMLVPLVGLLVGGGGRVGALAARLFGAVGADTRLSRLALLLALFAAVMLVRAVVLFARDRRLAALRLGFVERERVALVRALAMARWQDVAGLRHARVTAALGGDVQRVAAAAQALLQAAVAALMLVVQALLAALIAPVLALAVLALLAAGAAAAMPGLRRAVRVGEDFTAGQLRLMHGAGQFLAGLKPAMAQGLAASFADAVATEAAALSRQQRAFEARQSAARIGLATGAALIGAGLLLLGLWAAVPVASLLAAIVVLSRMSGPVLQLHQAVQQLATLLPAHASLVALRADLGTATDRESGGDAPATGTIRFEGVSHLHPDGGGVRDIDLVITPGEVIGLVGASGAGKTTLVDLLAGLIAPQRGRITIGGRPLAALDRSRIGYITQDGFLVHDTIRRNLTLGGPGVDDAALFAVLDRVGAAAMVAGFPAGLDTIVAERGARLSGGERQRIVLARALLRAPALLILDETTNAIDVEGERAILDALAARPDRPTLVMVAHREETLARCDRRLTLEHGRLV